MEQGNEPDRWLDRSFNETRAAAAILRAVYVVVILFALAIGLATVRNTDDPMFVKLGLIVGLVGFTIIAVQVFLGSRLRVLDRAFGLDRVVILHRRMGLVAGGLLIIHPLLLALGQKSLILFALHTSWKVNLGKGALLLLIAGVLLALFYARLRMDYNVWRLFHKAMIVVVALAFVHSLIVGDAFEIGWIKVWWWVLAVVACGAFTWQNFITTPFGRRKFIVKSVTRETHDTFTLKLEPIGKGVFSYRPGQFMFLKLQRKGLPSEEHPFTISSSPTEQGEITATIKKSGNYTDGIDLTKPGDKALIQAPFGRFSWVFDNPPSFLFIAGGVGITPIHSMIAALRDVGDKRETILLYGNKTEADIIFRGELEKLPANFKVVHVLSLPDKKWSGLTGYINAETISRQAGSVLEQAYVYLCGPPSMMKSVLVALKSLGIDNKRIHYERFTI